MNLKAYRKAKGLRQVDLASAAKISHSLVVKLEKEERTPSVLVAKRIAKILDFDWTKFFE